MEALIAALLRLLEGRGAGEISVRDVAAEAGVNHGLVHHYFGSKEGLIREAAARTAARMLRDHPPGVRLAWTFASLRANSGLARVVARLCLDGPHDVLAGAGLPPDALRARAAAATDALARAGLEGAIDPRVLVGGAIAFLLGWIVFRPLLEAGYDLPPDADLQLARVLAIIDAALAPDA